MKSNLSKKNYALWAEDINSFLHSGYNSTTLQEIQSSLKEYVKSDQERYDEECPTELDSLLRMTGLSLHYSKIPFPDKNICD